MPGSVRKMSKILVWVLVLVAIVGGAVWLAGSDATKPLTKVEKVIADNALGQ